MRPVLPGAASAAGGEGGGTTTVPAPRRARGQRRRERPVPGSAAGPRQVQPRRGEHRAAAPLPLNPLSAAPARPASRRCAAAHAGVCAGSSALRHAGAGGRAALLRASQVVGTGGGGVWGGERGSPPLRAAGRPQGCVRAAPPRRVPPPSPRVPRAFVGGGGARGRHASDRRPPRAAPLAAFVRLISIKLRDPPGGRHKGARRARGRGGERGAPGTGGRRSPRHPVSGPGRAEPGRGGRGGKEGGGGRPARAAPPARPPGGTGGAGRPAVH